MPHSAQSQHTNYWAPRTRKRHQQEHRPQRPTEGSNPTQHAKGRTGDRPGPRKGATTKRNVTQGGKMDGAVGAKGGGCQKALTQRSTRREERLTVEGPVKKLQPDEMSHRGLFALRAHLFEMIAQGAAGLPLPPQKCAKGHQKQTRRSTCLPPVTLIVALFVPLSNTIHNRPAQPSTIFCTC